MAEAGRKRTCERNHQLPAVSVQPTAVANRVQDFFAGTPAQIAVPAVRLEEITPPRREIFRWRGMVIFLVMRLQSAQ